MIGSVTALPLRKLILKHNVSTMMMEQGGYEWHSIRMRSAKRSAP
jgi:hypothetical protein